MSFFIEWAPQTPFPDAAVREDTHASLTRLDIEMPPDRLATRLGKHSIPIRVSAGERGVTRVVLEGLAGEIVLESAIEP